VGQGASRQRHLRRPSDDPEFGYRFLAGEVRQAGFKTCDRTVWRICRDNAWWSVFGKPKNRKKGQPGTPAHDDLVRRRVSAEAPNRLWLTDITEHRTDEGKLYLCAIKDVFSNRIVGWSIDSRMKARLVVAAIEMAVAREETWLAASFTPTADRSSALGRSNARSAAIGWSDPWAKSAPPATTPTWSRSLRSCSATCSTAIAGRPATSSASR
jgi:putative transposase